MKNYLKIIICFVVITIAINANYVFAGSASLFMTSAKQNISPGDQFTVEVKVNSTDQSINAVSGSIIFPPLVRVVSVSKDRSILNFWTENPNTQRNKISFEGVILNPGYQGNQGTIFSIIFEARSSGTASLYFNDGAILANDGLGTNIIGQLNRININIKEVETMQEISRIPVSTNVPVTPKKILALPVFTEYSQEVYSKDNFYLKGKGEPGALTKISFEDISHKSFGEQFMDFIQSKKKRITDVLVKNNEKGLFEYYSQNNLIAGVYNATPFLVDDDTNTHKPGLGIQLLVKDNKIIKMLIILINILLLLIPIVGLIMIIYFIPWYSARRIRIMNKKMGLEEEKISLTEHQLKRQEKLLDEDKVPLPQALPTEKSK